MRIITAGNLQLDREISGKISLDQRLTIARNIAAESADAILYMGDMAANYDDFMRGFEIISKCDASTRLWILGNRDLLSLKGSKLTEHYEEMRSRAIQFGFHLLDDKPQVINGVGFAGNVSWYDTSLFKPPINGFTDYSFPKTHTQADRLARINFHNEFSTKLKFDLSYDSFFEHCYDRLERHVKELVDNPNVQKIVLATHHTPSQKLVRYGESEEFDFWNMYMGSDALAPFFNGPKISLGLCAQTVRSESVRVGKSRLYSVGLDYGKGYLVFNDDNRFNFELEKVIGERPIGLD